MNSTRLSDILANGNRTELTQAWESTKPAEEFAPLPSGEYVAHVISGELFTARQNHTPGYKLTFKVIEGPLAKDTGRQFWHDLWLTEPALPMAKRDLAKLGITTLQQLDQPLPQGIRCRVKLALRRDDAGAEYNRVRSFQVIGIDKPEVDVFAPVDAPAPESPDGGAGAVEPIVKDDAGGLGDGAEGTGPLPPKPDDGIPV